jgi:hypothetical protein
MSEAPTPVITTPPIYQPEQKEDTMPSTQRVSSRMAKTEQKKLLKQTFWFGAGAVALLLIFVFMIIPGVIKLRNVILGGSDSLQLDNDAIPPQVPVFAAPPTATFSAQVKFAGYGEAESELVWSVNGQEAGKQKIPTTGEIDLEVSLTEGENLISAYAVDSAGNQSAATKTYKIVYDNQPPKIEISEPTDGQTIELRKNQLVTIKGITEELAKVYINGRLVSVKADGSFSTTYQLQEGENKLHFEAKDEAGNTTTKDITVNFKF